MEIVQLKDIGTADIPYVGGKAGSLGEMLRNLPNVRIPDGFVVTTNGFKKYMQFNNLDEKISKLLDQIDTNDTINLRRTALEIRTLILEAEFPADMAASIAHHYEKLSNQYLDVKGNPQNATDVAVRSSGTTEDSKEASYAGQYSTYLNIRSKHGVLEAIKQCYASLYNDRSIHYRKSMNYTKEISMATVVQKMVRADLHSAGVCFSLDTESGFRDVVIINVSWGLGEMVVSGSTNPDEYVIYKPKLKEGYKAIIDKRLGNKQNMMIYSTTTNASTKIIPVAEDKANQYCMTDDDILQLSRWVCEIEDYYTKLNGYDTPVDVEFSYDGISKQLFVVQARPESVHSNKKNKSTVTQYKIHKTDHTATILSGISVGDKIASGKVKIIHSLDNRNAGSDTVDFNQGDILCVDTTTPDWLELMQKASAIITNTGSKTCHASIVARELHIPCVVATNNATHILKNNQVVTVSCAEGDIGYVYDGEITFEQTDIDIETLPKVKTNIMFNIASPNDVFRYHNYPVAGVGLVREEFIINNFIQAHPMALIEYDKQEPELKLKLDKLIVGYNSPVDYYVNKLTFGLSKIAATFYPRPIIVRFSDFKSNEYRGLLGGDKYEPADESNPMLGWRGCSRYYDPKFEQAFGLECIAIKKVREELGLDNVLVMLPFCRTVGECIKVQETMKKYGLERGHNGLQVYVMCEIPSNVILADEFCKHVDGFSIGSNDLTQLTLGMDRDSGTIAHISDERDPAVKIMISWAIQACKKNRVKAGLCGQGPSDHPDFAQFLVEEGIDSISITPDAFVKTVHAIHAVEQKIENK